MTDLDLHEESERLIEEARLEIEAIKRTLEANRQLADDAPRVMPATAQVETRAGTGRRTN